MLSLLFPNDNSTAAPNWSQSQVKSGETSSRCGYLPTIGQSFLNLICDLHEGMSTQVSLQDKAAERQSSFAASGNQGFSRRAFNVAIQCDTYSAKHISQYPQRHTSLSAPQRHASTSTQQKNGLGENRPFTAGTNTRTDTIISQLFVWLPS